MVLGSHAMRPSEFFSFLNDSLQEIRSGRTKNSDECLETLFKVMVS
jgi:hypothetical protein